VQAVIADYRRRIWEQVCLSVSQSVPYMDANSCLRACYGTTGQDVRGGNTVTTV